jgi:hypothetical protein
MDFFKIVDSDQLSSKYLLRTFILQHSIYHPMRKIYTQLNDDINAIIDTFKVGTTYDEFLDDNHKWAITGPVDVSLKLINLFRD